MENRAKEQYDFILDTDSLRDLYPEMSGDWEKDKVKFIKEYEEMVILLESANIPINFEDFEDTEYDDLFPLDY